MNYKQTRAAIANAAAILRKSHPKGGSPTHAAMVAAIKLDECLDATEWTEKGLVEWREQAMAAIRQREAVAATARIAINHLQAVLNKSRTHHEQQAAGTAAGDWLISIGSEPS